MSAAYCKERSSKVGASRLPQGRGEGWHASWCAVAASRPASLVQPFCRKQAASRSARPCSRSCEKSRGSRSPFDVLTPFHHCNYIKANTAVHPSIRAVHTPKRHTRTLATLPLDGSLRPSLPPRPSHCLLTRAFISITAPCLPTKHRRARTPCD